MLTESLKYSNDSEYIHVPYGSDASVSFCNWESIYECIVNNGLLNIPINILFHYNTSVLNEIVVAVSPVNNNSPIGILFEGYNMNNCTLQDNDKDGLEDNNSFDYLSEYHHRNIMNLLDKEGLLNQEVNILYKVNNHVNDVVKICYIEDNSKHTIYTYNHNIREIAFIVSSSDNIEEIDKLLEMKPVNVFIKKL